AVLDRLPLAFEANQGQLDPAVRFVARSPGYQVLLTGDGLLVAPSGAGGATVGVTLDGARPNVQAVGQQPLPGATSYFVGDDPSRWRSAVSNYGAVSYPGVYPGVDLVFHGDGRHVEHDFVVAPGADPGVIGLVTHAAGATRIGGNGDLVLPSPGGDVRLQTPHLYQDVGGRRRVVAGRYEFRGDGRYGFAVGAYDHSRPLVIDPVLVSSSYLGGTSTDTAYGVATDNDGNILITGYTESSDFPTVNPAQTAVAQAEGTRTDVFVTKVKADGGTVLWSTYLGGRGRDAAFAVAVGNDGSVYLTGYTESPDFPTVRAIRTANAGGSSDVFVAKLNPAGSALVYSTYLGGKGADSGSGIAVDASGAAYVVGATGSSDFPVAKAFQETLAKPDDVDGFVMKIDPTGATLVFSSFLGGAGDDHAIDVAIDGDGNMYVTGDTRSSNFPVVRPLQPTPGGAGTGVGGNFTDAFVTKVKGDGSGLVYSTYLGGADSDKGTGIAVDSSGAAYLTGNTGSANFPVLNAEQPKKDGDFDAFVTKVKPDGSGLVYSTYLGGNGSDGAEAVAVDRAGHAHVVGATASTNFPTSRPFQAAKGGGFVDAFVTDVGASGNSLTSSSYLGGRDDDQAASVAIDKDGNVIVAGYTNSADFPIAKPFQPGKGGGVGDAFISKVREERPGETSASGTPAASKHEKRVRTLITITGGLFLAAVLQSVWLRRRPSAEPKPEPGPKREPEPVGAPTRGATRAQDAVSMPGVQYVPRRTKVDRGTGTAPSEDVPPAPAPVAEGRTGGRAGVLVDEQAEQDEHGEQGDDLWGPDRPWRRRSRGPDWDLGDRPKLR
ncbi:MAG: SBBP repeat-containing protein, partial [Actinobacteria bacterium]|nr:SBBP repeat-containing protein [Actinomycetota bacterium]